MAVSQLFAEIEGKLKARPPQNMKAVFQFNIIDDDTAIYTISIDQGKVKVAEGPEPEADIKITISAHDFQGLLDGSLDSIDAFLKGQIVIDGDVGLAMKLEDLIK